MTDMFRRTEYQLRGSPHSHGLYWIEGAPEYDEDDNNTERLCAEFIDEYITVENDRSEEMKELIKVQTHRHTHTCYKLRGKKICRFGFPLPPLTATKILLPLPNDVPESKKREYKVLYKSVQDDLTRRQQESSVDIGYQDFLTALDISEERYILGILRYQMTKSNHFLLLYFKFLSL